MVVCLLWHQLQLNTLNRDKLLDAKEHPELHRDLIVRVWGWSGYFVELDREFQDQIIKRVPAYALLHQVRPGITSMGMVKFGYAKNVDEMVERVKYDLMYLDNMSLLNDLKILIYTIKIVFTGRGM